MLTARRLSLVLAFAAVSACAGNGTDSADGAPVTSAPGSGTVATTPPATVAPIVTVAPTEPTQPTEPPSTVRARTYDFSAVGPIVDAFVAEHELNGAGLVIVERDDGIVHEQYWGEFAADRISLVASSSKMVTAGVLLRLHDDGLLDIDTPIAEYVDWGAGNSDVTVAQLLSNSSGLVGLLPEPGYGPYICQYLAAGTLQECGRQVMTTSDDDADQIPPDTEFRYGGAQWQVAGAVAEAVSGKPWSQLIDEIYAVPCDLETLGYNNHFTQLGAAGFEYPTAFAGDPANLQPTDNPNMEGGMYTAPHDYATLLLMHLRGGRCDGGQVLSPEALARAHSDRVEQAYGSSAQVGTGYGMGWWVDRASGRISDAGAYGSVPWLDLDGGFGAYLVIEADSGTGDDLSRRLFDAVEAAVVAARGDDG